MMRLTTSVLFLSVILSMHAAWGAIDLDSVTWEVTELDYSRARADTMRSMGDFDGAVEVAADILNRAPGDGFALRTLALVARDMGELSKTAGLLGRGEEPYWLRGIELEEADSEFLLGLIQYYRGRNLSASHRFEAAMVERPGWGWPVFYLGRALEGLLRPWEECEEKYKEALADPSVVPALLENFLLRYYPHRLSAIRESALDRLSALPAIPWMESPDLYSTLDELENLGQLTPEDASRWWLYLRERHHIYLLNHFDFITSLLTRHLTPAEFDEFVRVINAEGYEKRLVEIARAHRLLYDDRPLEASSVIDSLGDTTSLALEIDLDAATHHGSASEIVGISSATLKESVNQWTVSRSRWAYREIGDKSLDSLLSDAMLESPVIAMSVRLNDLQEADSHAAAALIDSLVQSGVEYSAFLRYQLWMKELRGDSDEVETILSHLPLYTRPSNCLRAASGAQARGDKERAVALIRRSFELFPRSVFCLSNCIASALDAGDRRLVEDLLEALTAACPECPSTVGERIRALMWLNRNQEARELLTQAVENEILSPKSCCILTGAAMALGEDDLAEDLLARAERDVPASPLVRGTAAMVLSRRGEAGEAREILEGLVAEFPTSEVYRSRLLSVGGSVQQADIPGDQEAAVGFEVFGHDLESTDWLIERAARADTMRNTDAVFLLKNISCVVDGVDRATERNRKTIYLRTENAVRFFQPFEIPFNASDAIPKVRMARIIRPDGTVINVPGTDIMVKADQKNLVDVDDSRALVIPFPGLEPGTVIDIAYDREITGWYSSGWSKRYLLPELFHVFEVVVELAYPPEQTIHMKASGDVGEAMESESGGRILRTWRVEDMEPVVLEFSAPDYYDIYPWIGISTHESIEASLDMYRIDFWSRMEESEAIREKANDITRGSMEKREKFDAIFAYMVENVRYVAIELREGRIVPSNPSEVMERGYGDCKDMVALLISMLGAVGVDAEPFLVTAGGGPRPVEDFPEPYLADHVIVLVPSLDSLYADPAAQDRCPLPAPASLAGAYGIALPREGHIRRARIPEAKPEEHGFSLEADLRLVPGNRARLEIRGVYRGELADAARKSMAQPDSTDRAAFVKEKLGYGLWEDCRMVGWDLVEENCAKVVLEAVFEDSCWAEGSLHSIMFPWQTEVADPVMFYPNPSDRELPFVMPFPFKCEAVLRLHDSPVWEAKVPIPVKVAGAGYEGSMSSERVTDSSGSHIEIRQHFTMKASRFDRAGYEEFWRDWVRFVAGLYQTYTYRRSLDNDELEGIEDYVRTHPDDAGFALQAALQIMGDDGGGKGEAGRKRREVVRAMITPYLDNSEGGSWPSIILATADVMDGRYLRADSLITVAIQREPGNQIAQFLALTIKDELGQLDELIDLHKSLLQRSANKAYEVSLIACLQEAGRSDEVEAAVSRYRLLYGSADSLAIRHALLRGTIEGHRCGQADSIFAIMKAGLDEIDCKKLESMIRLCHDDVEGAGVLLEEIWEEEPFNAIICNNLAWCYALLGRDLERAEELTELAVLAESDNTASRNTLAAIYARRGEWERARPIYIELRDADDRPHNFDTNEFFLGLCDYQMGRKEEATRRWRRIAKMHRDYDAARWSAEALRLDAEGRSVLGAVFKNLGSE